MTSLPARTEATRTRGSRTARLLQPIADGAKLFFKETVIPSGANRVVFVAAPVLTFTLALIACAVIPFDYGVVIADINVGITYLFVRYLEKHKIYLRL